MTVTVLRPLPCDVDAAELAPYVEPTPKRQTLMTTNVHVNPDTIVKAQRTVIEGEVRTTVRFDDGTNHYTGVTLFFEDDADVIRLIQALQDAYLPEAVK